MSLVMARIRGETDDLASLSRLDENILLEELRSRYSQDRIYVSQVGTHTPPAAILCHYHNVFI